VEGDGLRRELSAAEHVFGYGSLVVGAGVPARLQGRRRVWGVAMDNRVDLPGYKCYLAPDGSRPEICVAFLDLAPDGAAGVDGLCLPVGPDALARLDARERNYERVDVTGDVAAAAPLGRVWAYVGRADSRARFAAARREGRCAIAHLYLEQVEAGLYAVLGDADGGGLREAARRSGLPVRDLRRVDLPG
jgi:hypothetical protein